MFFLQGTCCGRTDWGSFYRRVLSREEGQKMIKNFLKIFLASMVMSILTVNGSYAIGFEDYKWGTPRQEVQKTMKAKGRDFVNNKGYIEYDDKQYGYDCEVKFWFTPTSDLLAYVEVIWLDIPGEDIQIFYENMRDALTDKYGQASYMDEYNQEYQWNEDTDYNKFVFQYAPPLSLIYYGGEYFAKYIAERGTGLSTMEMRRFEK